MGFLLVGTNQVENFCQIWKFQEGVPGVLIIQAVPGMVLIIQAVPGMVLIIQAVPAIEEPEGGV
jgi:hypothetical protein